MDFAQRFKDLRLKKGLTQAELGEKLGLHNSTISMYERGEREPDFVTLALIAKYFRVDVDYLLSDVENNKPLYRASAGDGAYNDTYPLEYVSSNSTDDGYEFATVVGNSMLPELKDGDIVKIKPQAETTPQDYTLVKVDGEHATIKFVEIVSDGVWLRALNKEVYSDCFYSIQEVMTLPVTIIGKVVELQRKF